MRFEPRLRAPWAALRGPFLLLLTLALAAPLSAQEMASDLRASLLDDFERMRGNVLGMVDAMPASGLRTAPTEGVRDFAQQIEHVVQGNVGIIQSGVDAPVETAGFDPEVYLNDKAELARYVNAGFDAVADLINAIPDDGLRTETPLFGQAQVETWKLVQTAYEHGVWTLGATVPYLRLNDSAPPGYNLIPSG